MKPENGQIIFYTTDCFRVQRLQNPSQQQKINIGIKKKKYILGTCDSMMSYLNLIKSSSLCVKERYN